MKYKSSFIQSPFLSSTLSVRCSNNGLLSNKRGVRALADMRLYNLRGPSMYVASKALAVAAARSTGAEEATVLSSTTSTATTRTTARATRVVLLTRLRGRGDNVSRKITSKRVVASVHQHSFVANAWCLLLLLLLLMVTHKTFINFVCPCQLCYQEVLED